MDFLYFLLYFWLQSVSFPDRNSIFKVINSLNPTTTELTNNFAMFLENQFPLTVETLKMIKFQLSQLMVLGFSTQFHVDNTQNNQNNINQRTISPTQILNQ